MQAYANIFGYIGTMFSVCLIIVIVIVIVIGKLLLLPILPLSFYDNQHSTFTWIAREKVESSVYWFSCLPSSNILLLLNTHLYISIIGMVRRNVDFQCYKWHERDWCKRLSLRLWLWFQIKCGLFSSFEHIATSVNGGIEFRFENCSEIVT